MQPCGSRTRNRPGEGQESYVACNKGILVTPTSKEGPFGPVTIM